MAGKKETESGMTVINRQIEAKEFSGLYLLTGTEPYLIAQYREKLTDALISREDTMNLNIYKSEGIRADEICQTATTMPFFADRRVVVILDSGYFKKGNEEIQALCEELPAETVIIFAETEVDKRGRLYKHIAKAGTVAVFDTPDEKTLLIWLKSLFKEDGLAVDDAALYKLLSSVGMDMVALSSEVEKLKCYALEKGNVTEEDVEKVCVSQVEDKIFEMTDALSARDRDKVLRLYEDLLTLREPMMRTLALITRQYRILLKCSFAAGRGTPYGEIASFAGVAPFFVKKYLAMAGNYTEQELLDCVERCQTADTNIKTGKQGDRMAVETLILDLLNV